MIEVFTLRIIGGILLASAFLIIYVVNFRSDGSSEGFETMSKIQVATSIEVMGTIAAIVVPLVAITLLVFLPSTVYGTLLNFYFPGDTFVQLAGIFLYAIGGGLLIWSSRHLGKFDTSTIAIAQDYDLVDTGPYARVRHPGYTATFLLAFAVLLILLNYLFIVNLFVVAAYHNFKARLGETPSFIRRIR